MARRIALAALGACFVVMTATVVGFSQADSGTVDLIRAYRGGGWQELARVQLHGAIPSILAGLRVGAPNVVRGAILAEFGGGERWGLGTDLLGSLGRGESNRLWGIGLVATAVAGAGYLLFPRRAGRLVGATRSVTLNAGVPNAPRPRAPAAVRSSPRARWRCPCLSGGSSGRPAACPTS